MTMGHRITLLCFTKEAKRQEEVGKANSTFHMDQLKVFVGNLFGRGSETTSNTLLVGLLYMMENLEIGDKVRRELDAVADRNQIIRMEVKSRFPYTEATILEMHRLASAAPLGVFHRTTELSTLNGYSVPANSIVIGNIGAAHRDARVFPDPEKFDPNRFLHKEGNFVKSPYVVPFSIGRHACLGENLAQMELFLLFTNLLYTFTITVPKGCPRRTLKWA